MSAIAVFAFLAAQGSPLPSVDVVVQNVRTAIRADLAETLDHALKAQGSAVFFGEKGRYELLIAPQGRFAEHVDGALGMTRAFDGTVAWEADWTGATRTLSLKDRELTLAQTAIQTGRWTTPNGMFDISVDAEGSDAATIRLKLNVRGGIHSSTLEIDRKTWLPFKDSYEDSAGEAVTTFSDWRMTPAGRLPFSVVSSEGGLTNTVTIEKIDDAPTFIRSPYTKPPWKAVDTRFDATLPARVEMKRAFTGHILVHPRVDGQDVGWFILDSGAGTMVIDPKIADSLKMPAIGEIPVVGVGGVLKGHFRTGREFTLGQATISNLKYVEIDLEQISTIFRTKVAGIAGYDVFRRAIVSLDLAAKTLAIEDPARYQLDRGDWIKLALDGKHPIVEAQYEGDQTAMFRIDTGASGTVTFGGKAARTLSKGRETRDLMLGGVGGMIPAKQGALDWFVLSGHRFDKPQVTFMTGERNVLANEFLAGNIGQDFLMPFRLVFDYGAERIAFVPNGQAFAPASWPTPLLRP